MSDTPLNLLRQIDSSLHALPGRLALLLERQRQNVNHGVFPGADRGDGRDARGRFLPGHGGGRHRQYTLSHLAGIAESAAGILPPLPPLQAIVHKGAQVARLADRIGALASGGSRRRGRRGSKRYAPPPVRLRIPKSFQIGRRISSYQVFQKQNKTPPAPRPTPQPVLPPVPATVPQPYLPSVVSSPFWQRKTDLLQEGKLKAQRREDEALRRSLENINKPREPALPPYLQKDDLGRTPDQAARLAKDRAIAAGKSSTDVENVGRRAFDFAHKHTTNRGAVFQRELLRAQNEGLDEEAAMKRARERAESVGNATRRFGAPTARGPQDESASLLAKGQATATGGVSLTSGVEELSENIEKLKGSIDKLNSSIGDREEESRSSTGDAKGAVKKTTEMAQKAISGNKAGLDIVRELGHVAVEGPKAIVV